MQRCLDMHGLALPVANLGLLENTNASGWFLA